MISMFANEEFNHYVAIKKCDIPGYDDANDYFIIGVVGDCMNHPDSPITVGTGDHVLCHDIDRLEFFKNWERYQGRMIIFSLDKSLGGKIYIKQFKRIEHDVFKVRLYNPPQEWGLPIEFVTDICIVDKVMTIDNKTN